MREALGRTLLREVRATLTTPGPPIIYDIREGDLASEQLLLACGEHNARTVLVGHRGRGRLIGELLGSTARDIADRAPCPVFITKTRSLSA